jgi:Tol biopolymer transport system component
VNKYFSQHLLKILLLLVIAISSGCGPAVIVPPSTSTPAPSQTPTDTATPSPTDTPEPIQPKGILIYSDENSTYALDLQNRKITTIVPSGNADYPYPVIDGNTIYFLQRPKGGIVPGGIFMEQPHQIFKINLDGTGLEQLTFDDNSHDKSELSGSPNSDYLAYAESGDTSSILLFDKNQRDSRIIMQDSKFDYYQPTWSPNGKYIAFFKTTKDDPYSSIAVPSGHLILYSIDDKKILEPIPEKESPIFLESWSPDSKSIAFNVGGNVPANIVLLNVSGIFAGQNTEGTYYNMHGGWYLNWSPNGKMILFDGVSKEYKDQLFLLNLDSGEISPISFGQQRMAGYCGLWSPDGSDIAFVTSTGMPPFTKPSILNIQNIVTGELLQFEIPSEGWISCISWQAP